MGRWSEVESVPFLNVAETHFRELGFQAEALDAILARYEDEARVGLTPTNERDALALCSLAECAEIAERKRRDD